MVHGLDTLRKLNGTEPIGDAPAKARRERSPFDRLPNAIALNPLSAREYLNSPWGRRKLQCEGPRK